MIKYLKAFLQKRSKKQVPLPLDGVVVTVTFYAGPRLSEQTPIPSELILLVMSGKVDSNNRVNLKGEAIASGVAEWVRYTLSSVPNRAWDFPVIVADDSMPDTFALNTRNFVKEGTVDATADLKMTVIYEH
jgi:hypothetical protein